MNVHLLERVTSSGKIIKYIDGLRFMQVFLFAIFWPIMR